MKENHVIVSHESAARYWRFAQQVGKSRALPPLESIGVPSTRAELRGALEAMPLHIVVLDPAKRHSSQSYNIHFFGRDMPAGALKYSTAHTSVISPELTFLQMANNLSLVCAVEFATNLCADYYIDYNDRSIARRTAPLTTCTKLRAFIEANRGLPGARKARTSLKWVHDSSLSPMESKLATLFAMPRRAGGYGFSDFSLNYRIAPGKSKSLTKQQYFLGDICWPDKKVIVEYDGLDYHLDELHDKNRSNGLEALGWKVFYLTKKEIFAPGALDLFVRQVAHVLHVRLNYPPGWQAKNLQLRSELRLVRNIQE